jgi:hypothetical protein
MSRKASAMTDRLAALVALKEAVEAGKEYVGWALVASVFGDKYVITFDRAKRGSVDAALSLREAVLPGWDWGATKHSVTVWFAGTDLMFTEDNLDLARALLLAIIAALIEIEEERNAG